MLIYRLKQLTVPAILFVLTICNQALCSGTLPPEFHLRDGLPNFFSKVNNGVGREICIAYIGGSITEAPNGWRDLTLQGIKTTYPRHIFRQVDAAIGGTGSALGVFRLDRDVLQYEPDLVFIEFAVNDYGYGPELPLRTIEGMVRKIRAHHPETDICLVYTVSENMVKTISEGKYQHSAETMEKIAQYYRLPSIHMGVEVVRLWQEGRLVIRDSTGRRPGQIVFTKDGVHPLPESGHPLYAHVVMKYLRQMERYGNPRHYATPPPLFPDNWERAVMLSLPEPTEGSGWQKLEQDHELVRRFSKFTPVICKARAPGARLLIRFSGRKLGFYDIIGPGTGILDVRIDGVLREVHRFDKFSDNFRKNYFFLEDLADGVHEVEILVSGRSFDKAAILKTNGLSMDKPDRYRENTWYPCNLLVIGDLISFSLN